MTGRQFNLVFVLVLAIFHETNAMRIPRSSYASANRNEDTTIILLDDRKYVKNGVHVALFDLVTFQAAFRHLDDLLESGAMHLLMRANINPLNEDLRLEALRAVYPEAKRAYAHIRPCFRECEGTISRVAWRFTRTQPENIILERIFNDTLPSHCISGDIHRRCYYLSANRLPLYEIQADSLPTALVAHDEYPVIELDLSPGSILWKSNGGPYTGYVMSRNRLVLSKDHAIHRNIAASLANHGQTEEWRSTRYLKRISVDPRTMCSTHNNNNNGDNDIELATCFDPTKEENRISYDALVHMSHQETNHYAAHQFPVSLFLAPSEVIGDGDKDDGSFSNGRGITWIRRKTAIVDHPGRFIVEWGQPAFRDNVEAIHYIDGSASSAGSFSHQTHQHSLLWIYVAPTAGLTPSMGWLQAICMAILVILFFRRNLTPASELRYSIRRHHIKEIIKIAEPMIHSSERTVELSRTIAFFTGPPSNTEYNRLYPGDILSDWILVGFTIGGAIAYLVASLTYPLEAPTISSYYFYNITGGICGVLFIGIACIETQRSARHRKGWKSLGIATLSDTFVGVILRNFNILPPIVLDNNDSRDPDPKSSRQPAGTIQSMFSLGTSRVSSTRNPIDFKENRDHCNPYLTLASKGLGNVTTAYAFTLFLWWNTDVTFDWGVLAVVMALQILFLVHHILECVLFLGMDIAWAYTQKNSIRVSQELTSKPRFWLMLVYISVAIAITVVMCVIVIPQITLPFAYWITPANVPDESVTWCIWLLILPLPVTVTCYQVAAVMEQEHTRLTEEAPYSSSTMKTIVASIFGDKMKKSRDVYE